VKREGSCAQYGMMATEDIHEGEVLFQIPRSCLISPDTCAISDCIKKGNIIFQAAQSMSIYNFPTMTCMFILGIQPS
jgi:SET domain-containing protein 6